MSIIKQKIIDNVISYITHFNLEMEHKPLKILDFFYCGKIIKDNLIIGKIDGIINTFVYKYKNFYKDSFPNISCCIDKIEGNDKNDNNTNNNTNNTNNDTKNNTNNTNNDSLIVKSKMSFELREKNRYDIIIIDSAYLQETNFELSINLNKIIKKNGLLFLFIPENTKLNKELQDFVSLNLYLDLVSVLSIDVNSKESRVRYGHKGKLYCLRRVL